MNIPNQDFSLTFTNKSSVFTDNNRHSFTTPINPPIRLPQGEWEVGLTRIIVPRSQKHVLPETKFALILSLGDKVQKTLLHQRIEITFPSIEFVSFESVKTQFEELFRGKLLELHKQFIDSPDFKRELAYYKNQANEIVPIAPSTPNWLYIEEKDNWISLSAIRFNYLKDADYLQISRITIYSGLEFWHALGIEDLYQSDFRRSDLKLNTAYVLPAFSRYLPKFKSHQANLMLMAPGLVEEQNFGDQLLSILDLVPYEVNSSESYNVFDQEYPLYKNVLGGLHSKIDIEIRDINNLNVEFKSGILHLVLKFRKRKMGI